MSYYREPSAAGGLGDVLDRLRPDQVAGGRARPRKREALRADFIAFHAGFPTPLGICVPREYWLTVGVRQ